MGDARGTKIKSNSGVDESYGSEDEVLNDDDEKEMEYVTPGGPEDNVTPQ